MKPVSDDSTLAGLSACLREAARLFQEEENDPIWAARLIGIAERTDILLAGAVRSDERQQLGYKVQDMFGGMDGLTDQDHGLETARTLAKLWDLAQNVLRESWRDSGRPWHDVRSEDQFKVGAVVTLVTGEAIELNRDGSMIPAPASPIRYVVRQVLSSDVDNMPRYLIATSTRTRVARHNALCRAAV